MLGELSRSGVGEPRCVDCVKSIAELMASCARSNAALLRELREDSNADSLLAMTREDAALGRMLEPVPVSEADLSRVLLNPRFGVQQERDDGSCKVRLLIICHGACRRRMVAVRCRGPRRKQGKNAASMVTQRRLRR